MTKLWNYLKQKSKTLHELTKEFPTKTYRELEKYRDADRQEEAQPKEDWKKRAQEAEAATSQVEDELRRVERENNELHKKVAALLDAVDPDSTLTKARESGL